MFKQSFLAIALTVALASVLPGAYTLETRPALEAVQKLPTLTQEACPRLQHQLLGLMQASNPIQFAFDHSLYLTADAQVRVIIVLIDEEAAVPLEYLRQIETWYGDLLQAVVPVVDLCALSNEPQVNFVRAPSVSQHD